MLKYFAAVILFCVVQETIAYCCYRDSWMLPSSSCGCPDIDTCGIVTCSPCTACYVASSPCFRDTSNVCFVCDNPSPVCSCLRSLGDDRRYADYDRVGCCERRGCGERERCGCGERDRYSCGERRCGCEDKSYIYFPEVEYPTFVMETKPYYYSSCWCM